MLFYMTLNAPRKTVLNARNQRRFPEGNVRSTVGVCSGGIQAALSATLTFYIFSGNIHNWSTAQLPCQLRICLECSFLAAKTGFAQRDVCSQNEACVRFWDCCAQNRTPRTACIC